MKIAKMCLLVISILMVITTLICYFNIKKYLTSNKKIEKMEIEKRVKVFNILTVITMIFSIITLIIRIIK